MHPIQRRLIIKNIKFLITHILPFVVWAWLWYDGFKTF